MTVYKPRNNLKRAWGLAVVAVSVAACAGGTEANLDEAGTSSSSQLSDSSISTTTGSVETSETQPGDSDEASDGETGAQTADVQVEGPSLAPMPSDVQITDASTDPAYGMVGPTLIGTDFDGNELTIGPDGRAKVLYFVAHWCPHCQVEIPLVQSLIDAGNQPAEIDIYAISTAYRADSTPHPAEWLSTEGFEPPSLRDSDASDALVAYAGSGFPFAVYLDSDNRVIGRSVGSVDGETMVALWELTAANGALSG